MPGRLLRNLLLVIAIFVPFQTVSAGEPDEGNVLHLYTWDGYFAPDAVRLFEERHDCTVDFTYYESNETMFEAMHDGGGYDLITPSGNAGVALRKSGLLSDLDHSRIPNLRNINQMSQAMIHDPEMAYSVPYTITVTGIGYNTEEVPPDAPGTWDMFTDPRLRKRMAMLNDLRETLGAALKELGYSLNTTNEDEVIRAGKLLGMWKRNITRFEVEGSLESLQDGTLLAIQAYNGDIAKAMESHPDIGFFVPTTGSAINMDVFVVPADAEHPELAHAFINHFLDPDVAAMNMNYTCYTQPIPSALQKVSDKLRNNPAFALSPDIIEQCEVIRSLGDIEQVYDEVWTDVLLND